VKAGGTYWNFPARSNHMPTTRYLIKRELKPHVVKAYRSLAEQHGVHYIEPQPDYLTPGNDYRVTHYSGVPCFGWVTRQEAITAYNICLAEIVKAGIANRWDYYLVQSTIIVQTLQALEP